ncbi:MAG: 2Fe-2S iron-sulfur cluster binding domain-containing protein [Desulfobacterales bacterium]|nr:2Fe-2S iron-sulfur cluster binding domain-containing protein [Deltaproteobacteria bacterium]NNK95183.1 2Fe-2S iron-sulfur cluster binding domain-containing protein [Desulfobacterales bacterium]
MITLNINGENHQVAAEPGELLVWVIREKVGLTGTKFGCGIEMCGACRLLIDGEVKRSCMIDVAEVMGKKIVTLEGLPEDHPLKSAGMEHQDPA